MIDLIIEFVKAHPWIVFVTLGVAIGLHLAVFITNVARKPVKIIDSVKTLVVEYLPLVIKKVEDYSNHQKAEGLKPYTSSQKLEMAICVVEQYLIDQCGLTEPELTLFDQQ